MNIFKYFCRRRFLRKGLLHICFALLILITLRWIFNSLFDIAEDIDIRPTHNTSSQNFIYPTIYVSPPEIRTKSFLLILVSSSPHDEQHREKRNAIRLTWGNCDKIHLMYTESQYLPKSISCRLVFFMGRTANDTSIIQEAREHKDILIADYIDDYNMITKKLLLAFKWSNKYAPVYVLKTDDDVFVHVPRLILKLLTIKYPRYYGGVVWSGTVSRDPRHRHFVSYDSFRDYKFPPFCKGAFYVFSGKLLHELLNSVNQIKPFGIDDAYIGIVMRHIGVIPESISEFVNFGFSLFVDVITDCVLQRTIGLSDGLSGKQIMNIHDRIKVNELRFWLVCFQVPVYVITLLLIAVLAVLLVRIYHWFC